MCAASQDGFGLAALPPSARSCAAAAALTVIGEKWALLVVRELFFGVHRFDRIAEETGAPRDVLTARLRALESAGVLERRPYQDRPVRYEYHLTRAGRDLLPVLVALNGWGEKHLRDGERLPYALRHDCGHDLAPVTVCRHCDEPVAPGSLTVRPRRRS